MLLDCPVLRLRVAVTGAGCDAALAERAATVCCR